MECAAHARIKTSSETDVHKESLAVGPCLDSWSLDMSCPLIPQQRENIGSPLQPFSVSPGHCEGIRVETNDADVALDVKEESSYFASQNGGNICQPSKRDTIASISKEDNTSNDLRNKQIDDASTTELEKGGDEAQAKCRGDEKDEADCRVCHLSLNGEMEMIQLGCLCKQDLSYAHRLCAEAWFKIKGNRTCEICGSTAQNVVGMNATSFMDHWNERTYSSTTMVESSCWQSQALCKLLLACLVVAFLLPWLFHIIPV